MKFKLKIQYDEARKKPIGVSAYHNRTDYGTVTKMPDEWKKRLRRICPKSKEVSNHNGTGPSDIKGFEIFTYFLIDPKNWHPCGYKIITEAIRE